MIKKILVALDGSKLAEQVLPYARLLGEAYQCPIELLSIDEAEITATFGPSGGRGGDYLKSIAGQFPATLKIDAVVERGRPGDVIVQRAKLEPGCLIAMATHGLSGLKRWLLGSVAAKVIQAAENPLLLVRARGEAEATLKSFGIIVPLDGSELAEAVLPIAVDLAKRIKTEIVLVRAYELPVTAYYRTDDYEEAQAFIPTRQELVVEMSREAREYLDAKIKEIRDGGFERIRSEIVEGPAAERIIDLARTNGGLIAISTHGRSGVKRWVLGSVTEKVVRHSGDPVLVMRGE